MRRTLPASARLGRRAAAARPFQCRRQEALVPQRPLHPKRLRAHLDGKRVICLDIPDDYGFMDAALIRLLEAKVPPHLPTR